MILVRLLIDYYLRYVFHLVVRHDGVFAGAGLAQDARVSVKDIQTHASLALLEPRDKDGRYASVDVAEQFGPRLHHSGETFGATSPHFPAHILIVAVILFVVPGKISVKLRTQS